MHRIEENDLDNITDGYYRYEEDEDWFFLKYDSKINNENNKDYDKDYLWFLVLATNTKWRINTLGHLQKTHNGILYKYDDVKEYVMFML